MSSGYDDNYMVSVGILFQLLKYLNFLKIDRNTIFHKLGINPAVLSQPDARIPFKNYIALENAAAEISKDPFFGLHMAEFIKPEHYNIIGYMMMNSTDLAEAMIKLGKYRKLIGNLIDGKIRLGFRNVKLVFSTPVNTCGLSRHCIECAAASIIVLARQLTGKEIKPVSVQFSHPAPGHISEYSRIFKAPVYFNKKETAMVLDPALGKVPLPQPNKVLLDYFEKYAVSYLKEINENGDLSGTIIKKIIFHLDRKSLSISKIAAEMSMSTRTMQSRLKEEGCVFRELLENTRKNLAARYLKENYLVEEIALMLGYTAASAFSKAFKKWYGLSPKEYRKN